MLYIAKMNDQLLDWNTFLIIKLISKQINVNSRKIIIEWYSYRYSIDVFQLWLTAHKPLRLIQHRYMKTAKCQKYLRFSVTLQIALQMRRYTTTLIIYFTPSSSRWLSFVLMRFITKQLHKQIYREIFKRVQILETLN